MERRRLRKPVGVGMVAVGLVQAGFGVAGDDPIFAGLGVAYAALGAAYLYAEGYATDH